MATSKNTDKKKLPSRAKSREMLAMAVASYIKSLERGERISKEQCMLDNGYAPSTAKKRNFLIIQHPDYLAWVERKTDNQFASKSAIEKRFNKFANSNITDYYDIKDIEYTDYSKDGSCIKYTKPTLVLKDLKELPRELTNCIESIKETKLGTEIKLVSKLSALEDLAKMNGVFIAKVEHTGDVGPTIYYIGSDNLTKEVADKIATPKNRLKDYDNSN